MTAGVVAAGSATPMYRRSMRSPWLLAGLAALPGVATLVEMALHAGRPYDVFGDQAVTELNVRDVGSHPVLVGPYSRYGWYHPGPALFYLLAAPYRLLSESSRALAVGAVLVNAVCAVAVVLLIRRRAGTAAALWAMVVVGVYLRSLDGFLRDSWNPYLPLLPFAVVVLLGWTVLCGELWALPVATAAGTFCVQSHVEYALGVAAVAAVTSVGLVAQSVIAAQPTGRLAPAPRQLARWLATSLLVAAVLWTPPAVQQLTHSPGNLGMLLNYFRHAQPTASYETGAKVVGTNLGWPLAYLLGTRPTPQSFTPPLLPQWPGLVALAAFVVAVVVVARRRRSAALWLAGLTAALGLAAVVTVERVVGPVFGYLVQATAVVGMILWIMIGVVVLGAAGDPGSGRVPRAVDYRSDASRPARGHERLAVIAFVAVAAAAITLVNTVDSVGATTPQTDTNGVVAALDRGAFDLIGSDRRSVVRVDFAATTRRVIVGTSFVGSGVVLGLVKSGVHVQLSPFWRLPFGDRYTREVDRARWNVVVAYSDGSSPPPGLGQRLLAQAGEYEVYGGPLP